MLRNLKRGLNTAYIRNEYRCSLRLTIACWGRFVGGRVYSCFPLKDGGKPSITACGGKPGLQPAGTAPATPPCHSRSLLSGNPPLVGLMDCEYGFPLKDCGNDRIGVCGNSGRLQPAGTAPDTPPCHSRSLLSGNPPLVGLMDCEYGFPLKDCGNDRIGVCGDSGRLQPARVSRRLQPAGVSRRLQSAGTAPATPPCHSRSLLSGNLYLVGLMDCEYGFPLKDCGNDKIGVCGNSGRLQPARVSRRLQPGGVSPQLRPAGTAPATPRCHSRSLLSGNLYLVGLMDCEYGFPLKDCGNDRIGVCGNSGRLQPARVSRRLQPAEVSPRLQLAGTAPDTPPCHSRSLLSGNPPLAGLMDCGYGFPLKYCGNDRIGVCGNSGRLQPARVSPRLQPAGVSPRLQSAGTAPDTPPCHSRSLLSGNPPLAGLMDCGYGFPLKYCGNDRIGVCGNSGFGLSRSGLSRGGLSGNGLSGSGLSGSGLSGSGLSGMKTPLCPTTQTVQALKARNRLLSRFFKRAARFLWCRPLDTARSMLAVASRYAPAASSRFLPLTSFRNFLIDVRRDERWLMLRIRCLSFWRARFRAWGEFANVIPRRAGHSKGRGNIGNFESKVKFLSESILFQCPIGFVSILNR